jgi:hypothetical protein
MKKWIFVTMFLVILLVGYITIGEIMSDVKRPKYDVISSVDNLEIRQYESMIVAEVEVQGERDAAIRKGFRLLADYIFGNNTVQKDIEMTAPVQQQKNQKIAMTVPVQQQFFGDVWQISFVMPSEYSLATLPKPNNEAVKISQIPAKQFIATKFSGTSSNDNIAKHEKKLLQYIQKNKIPTRGSPKYAFYNPPWTLPFMRQNEIMMEIDEIPESFF